jgi:hypothetical protein
MAVVLLPVGKRPKCLNCGKELRPNFHRESVPYSLYGSSKEQEQQAWKKAHPRQFLGTYGGYRDNRFCGLNCGYQYALKVTNGKGR